MNFFVGLSIAVAAVLVIIAGSLFWVMTSITRETVSEVSTLNAGGGAGRALLVYQPGMSDFPERTVMAFADGLAAAGWAIDRTTASSKAPVNVADYQLIVLGSPIYAGAPAKPLSDYIARVGDFGGRPVAIVLAGAGETAAALAASEAAVRAAGGVIAGRFVYTSMRPNEPSKPYPGTNVEVALAMARDAGLTLDLTASR